MNVFSQEDIKRVRIISILEAGKNTSLLIIYMSKFQLQFYMKKSGNIY